MAYNNYYPVGYQPYTYNYLNNTPYGSFSQANEAIQQGQPTINQAVQNTPQNGLIWVQGEAGAKAYPVAPNATVQLWDSEAQIIYLKSADASGMPSMKILDYTVREAQPTVKTVEKPQVDLSGYVTKEEFEKRMAEVCRQTIKTKKVDENE